MTKRCSDCEYEWVPDDRTPCNKCLAIGGTKPCFKAKDGDTSKPEADVVNHPSHYETGKFECIEVMEEAIGKEAVMHFCICNAFKYLYRCTRKNGVEDIRKAQWYLNKYLELYDRDKEDFENEDN